MRRAFALPVSAAVVGAVLAITASVLARLDGGNHDRSDRDRADPPAAEVDLAEMEREMAEVIAGLGEIPIDDTRLPSTATISESSGTKGPWSRRGARWQELDGAVEARIEGEHARGGR